MRIELMRELLQYGPWGLGAVVLWRFRDYISVSFGSPRRREHRK